MSETHSDVVTFTDPEGRTVSTTRGSIRHVEHLRHLATLEDQTIADGVPIVDEPEPAADPAPGDEPAVEALPDEDVDVERPSDLDPEAAPKRTRRPRAAAES
ncbi:hypothetical protein A6F55_23725 [Prescottella equi]|uniref:hypothetical protein n=1 Tax=Rhodococcus hoagii TaxID=43767 RepID=UPI000A0F51A8|nr:hypothetical protein [Prescottella equi]ORJ92578.1 hypothetical protein A6F55_23725 [Prescottella equi]